MAAGVIRLSPALPLLALVACSSPSPDKSSPAPSASIAAPVASASASASAPRKLDRAAFNRRAVQHNLPLYWTADRNGNGEADPDEVAALQFYPTSGDWVSGGRFTPSYATALRGMETPESFDGPDGARIKLVVGELDNAAPALVANDLRKNASDHEFVGHMVRVATLLDELYALQSGASAVVSKLPPDAPSRSLFRRNWGIKCQTPGFDKNPACTAIAGGKQPVDVYPAALQDDPKFCEALEKRPDASKLLEPFTVVRDDGKGGLKAVPYSEAYAEPMKKVASELRAAGKSLDAEKEKALVAYLDAAARSFETNNWLPADEAWSRMTAENSAWYVRVAPDETYWEPCSQKAGFHLTFARINPDSLKWQAKLRPVQQEMEDRLAAHVEKPYKARKVTFHLPDFIDIVLNAGDDRDAVGATVGQSLPNWGKVSAEGRGRTVVMSNLYTDPDSLAVRRAKVNSLLVSESAALYADGGDAGLIGTILHEAAHNLGPTHEYKVGGKTDNDAFGGDLASMLEELKAQTASLWFTGFVQTKGIIDEPTARRVYADDLTWAFNHISRGMWTASHQRKHYSQLAAIQVGWMLEEQALVFDPAAKAANGKDQGAYRLDLARLPAAVDKLMKVVGHIKATGDKKAAEDLTARFVDGMPEHHARIAERCLRFPQPNFVYALEY